ncbi:hypothetical protein [Nocardia sp. CC201C]|uniref:hypothetical protein n=1 Tax=Nocardia sp. CC201C TaxID=3044575 RepID=UPI0024A7CA87|nr:hypothetical protein [Nocardia sp. CC201C]
MNDNPTRRIALVGIDGCGKSSVLARLRELAPRDRGFGSMTCPDFHTTANAPLHRLSQQLKAFSDGCDEIGSLECKAIALYLQMTLFGPVERFFVDTFAPDVLVCERHPLVETLVYGPFYVLLADLDTDPRAREAQVRDVLDRHAPGTLDDILAWYAGEAARLGTDPDIWNLLGEVSTLVQLEPDAAVPAFARRCRTSLPDAVLWLDVPPEQAAARCTARVGGGTRESHETPELLAELRKGYQRAQQLLPAAFPDLRFHRIDTADGVDLEESVRRCVEEGRLFA